MKSKQYLLFLLFIALAIYSPVINAQVINIFAGTVMGYSGDNGLATHARLNGCTNVAVDGAGNVYIADQGNNVVRKVSITTGIITTFAGKDSAGYSGDGAAATAAKLNMPFGLATDVAGNVYISDQGNNAVRVVSTAGIINTYAGNGTPGYSGDDSLASLATLNGPKGLAMDGYGNLYIADDNNNVVREVNALGTITTIAGNGTPGYNGDNGAAIGAMLQSPTGVAVDVFGNVYIADQLNHVVREVIYATGVIKTIAGNNMPGRTGDGGAATAAELYFPSGVSLDQAGSLYISDQGNYSVRKVDSLGNISLFAGNYTSGYTGDGGTPTNAELGLPSGVTADGWGRIYIADYNNSLVRIVTQGTSGIAAVGALSSGIKIYPNPTSGMFTIELPATANNALITVTDVLGNVVLSTSSNTQNKVLNLVNMPAGNYFIKVVNSDKTYTDKIEVLR